MALVSRIESFISFQKNDPFLTKYRNLIEQIDKLIGEKRYTPWELEREKIVKDVETLINQRFNISCVLYTAGLEAACIPFFLSDTNIFVRDVVKPLTNQGHVDDIRANRITATADMEKAKIVGDLSKAKSSLYLNFHRLLGYSYNSIRATYDEIIAITLHEIGHIFYAVAFANKIDKQNLIFEDVRRRVAKSPNDKKKIIYQAFKGYSPKIREGLCSDNPVVVTEATLALAGVEMLNQQAHVKYSETSFEQVADNFASRFGYGQYLVTYLAKYGKTIGEYDHPFARFAMCVEIAKHVLITLLAGLTLFKIVTTYSGAPLVSMLFMTLSVLVVYLVAVFIWIINSGDGSRNLTYDDLVHRFNRIRMDIINQIKDKRLKKADATRLLSVIDDIKAHMDKVNPYKNILDAFFNTFNPKDRRASESIGRQQLAEQLMSNELFVSSLRLYLKGSS